MSGPLSQRQATPILMFYRAAWPGLDTRENPTVLKRVTVAGQRIFQHGPAMKLVGIRMYVGFMAFGH